MDTVGIKCNCPQCYKPEEVSLSQASSSNEPLVAAQSNQRAVPCGCGAVKRVMKRPSGQLNQEAEHGPWPGKLVMDS